MRQVRLALGSFVAFGAWLAAACAPVAPGPGPAPPTPGSTIGAEVTVFAAASLTDAFRELGQAFELAHPGTHVAFNFGASSTLRAQLEQGARADVFASADQAQMDAARRADALLDDDRPFATNRLVLVVPKDNPARIHSLADLARPGVKLVTSQPEVPIGQYTLSMLDRASQDPAYGPDFRRQVEGQIVSREADVRAVVSKVQLGEADAAVVYATDVMPQVRDQVQRLPIPDSLNTLATYPIAAARGSNPRAGEAFVAFVLSPEGQAILARWGFGAPPALTG